MKKLILIFTAILILLTLNGCAIGEAVANAEHPIKHVMRKGASEPELNRKEAVAIALRHVGLTQEQVTGLRTELEVDDGLQQYDVEFWQGRWEYVFEIDAHSGEILSFEKDLR